jgi:hypothetical protein
MSDDGDVARLLRRLRALGRQRQPQRWPWDEKVDKPGQAWDEVPRKARGSWDEGSEDLRRRD